MTQRDVISKNAPPENPRLTALKARPESSDQHSLTAIPRIPRIQNVVVSDQTSRVVDPDPEFAPTKPLDDEEVQESSDMIIELVDNPVPFTRVAFGDKTLAEALRPLLRDNVEVVVTHDPDYSVHVRGDTDQGYHEWSYSPDGKDIGTDPAKFARHVASRVTGEFRKD